MIGCAEAERNGEPDQQIIMDSPAVSGRASASPAREGQEAGTVLFVGTSLTAGYGLSPEQAFPALIQQKIDSAGLPFRVVNAGVSGETSAGALRRMDWLLRQPFDVLVLETGANDMLRGTDIQTTASNIQEIVDRVRRRRPDAQIVLAGMLAPPNMGRRYAEAFGGIYPEIARRNNVELVPFILEGVGGVPALNQADGVHPTAEGQRLMAQNVWPVLEPVLREESSRASGADD